MTRKAWLRVVPIVAILGMITTFRIIDNRRRTPSLNARLEQIVRVEQHTEISCAELAKSRPLVLLAIGQSNAGNHGVAPTSPKESISLISEGKCIKATDPLPGGTGTGGSIWLRLPALLSIHKHSRPVVLSILAVDTSTIKDWTDPSSPLNSRLASHVASMRRLGLAPDLVLWQQGEADNLIGTSKNDYSSGLVKLLSTLKGAGTNAPIILARSTICKTLPNAPIRSAIEEATVSDDQHFRLGPDTDTLSSDTVRNGCHLIAEGLDIAAKMWAIAVNKEASTIE